LNVSTTGASLQLPVYTISKVTGTPTVASIRLLSKENNAVIGQRLQAVAASAK
jgi:hypothetical protein